MRPTSAQIDLTAIAHNVAVLTELAAPAQLCVVVKADGYGHGALPVARTAVSAGAPWLAVALVEEGIELRQGGIEVPILLLSEPRPNEMIEVFTHQLRPTVYSPPGQQLSPQRLAMLPLAPPPKTRPCLSTLKLILACTGWEQPLRTP